MEIAYYSCQDLATAKIKPNPTSIHVLVEDPSVPHLLNIKDLGSNLLRPQEEFGGIDCVRESISYSTVHVGDQIVLRVIAKQTTPKYPPLMAANKFDIEWAPHLNVMCLKEGLYVDCEFTLKFVWNGEREGCSFGFGKFE